MNFSYRSHLIPLRPLDNHLVLRANGRPKSQMRSHAITLVMRRHRVPRRGKRLATSMGICKSQTGTKARRNQRVHTSHIKKKAVNRQPRSLTQYESARKEVQVPVARLLHHPSLELKSYGSRMLIRQRCRRAQEKVQLLKRNSSCKKFPKARGLGPHVILDLMP